MLNCCASPARSIASRTAGSSAPRPTKTKGRRLDHDLVSLHDSKPRDHADQGAVGASPEPPVHLRITHQGTVAFRVGAAGQRGDAVRVDQPRRDVLSPDGLGDRHDECRRAAVEPAIGGVGSDGLSDVPRPHDRSRRGDQAIPERGEPVLLAAMHVHHVDVRHQGAKAPQVTAVHHRPGAAREHERGHPLHPFPACAIDHPRLRPGAAAERHHVTAPLELARHPRRPVGVGRPSAAGHQLEDSHRRS